MPYHIDHRGEHVLDRSFEQLAVGHVLDRAEHRDRPTGIVVLDVSQAVHPPLHAVGRPDDSVLGVETVTPGHDMLGEVCGHPVLVIRVDDRDPLREVPSVTAVHAHHAEECVRTVPAVHVYVVDVVPDTCDSLRLCEPPLAFLDNLLSELALSDVVGHLRQLTGEREDGRRDLLETLEGHLLDFTERCGEFVGIDSYLGRVFQIGIFVRIARSYLPDHPVGDMPAAGTDACARRPQAGAQTPLDDGPIRVVAAKDRIGSQAVRAALLGTANHLAQSAEVAGPGDWCPVGSGDERAHAGGCRQCVLQLLHLRHVEELLERGSSVGLVRFERDPLNARLSRHPRPLVLVALVGMWGMDTGRGVRQRKPPVRKRPCLVP